MVYNNNNNKFAYFLFIIIFSDHGIILFLLLYMKIFNYVYISLYRKNKFDFVTIKQKNYKFVYRT